MFIFPLFFILIIFCLFPHFRPFPIKCEPSGLGRVGQKEVRPNAPFRTGYLHWQGIRAPYRPHFALGTPAALVSAVGGFCLGKGDRGGRLKTGKFSLTSISAKMATASQLEFYPPIDRLAVCLPPPTLPAFAVSVLKGPRHTHPKR